MAVGLPVFLLEDSEQSLGSIRVMPIKNLIIQRKSSKESLNHECVDPFSSTCRVSIVNCIPRERVSFASVRFSKLYFLEEVSSGQSKLQSLLDRTWRYEMAMVFEVCNKETEITLFIAIRLSAKHAFLVLVKDPKVAALIHRPNLVELKSRPTSGGDVAKRFVDYCRKTIKKDEKTKKTLLERRCRRNTSIKDEQKRPTSNSTKSDIKPPPPPPPAAATAAVSKSNNSVLISKSIQESVKNPHRLNKLLDNSSNHAIQRKMASPQPKRLETVQIKKLEFSSELETIEHIKGLYQEVLNSFDHILLFYCQSIVNTVLHYLKEQNKENQVGQFLVQCEAIKDLQKLEQHSQYVDADSQQVTAREIELQIMIRCELIASWSGFSPDEMDDFVWAITNLVRWLKRSVAVDVDIAQYLQRVVYNNYHKTCPKMCARIFYELMHTCPPDLVAFFSDEELSDFGSPRPKDLEKNSIMAAMTSSAMPDRVPKPLRRGTSFSGTARQIAVPKSRRSESKKRPEESSAKPLKVFAHFVSETPLSAQDPRNQQSQGTFSSLKEIQESPLHNSMEDCFDDSQSSLMAADSRLRSGSVFRSSFYSSNDGNKSRNVDKYMRKMSEQEMGPGESEQPAASAENILSQVDRNRISSLFADIMTSPDNQTPGDRSTVATPIRRRRVKKRIFQSPGGDAADEPSLPAPAVSAAVPVAEPAPPGRSPRQPVSGRKRKFPLIDAELAGFQSIRRSLDFDMSPPMGSISGGSIFGNEPASENAPPRRPPAPPPLEPPAQPKKKRVFARAKTTLGTTTTK